MKTITLNSSEIATLLLLNAAVTDVIQGHITVDVLSELTQLQPNLEHILFKRESPLHSTV